MDYDYVFDLILFDGLKILLFILILFFVILILVIDPYLPYVVLLICCKEIICLYNYICKLMAMFDIESTEQRIGTWVL